jgi:hypothetical protein
MIRNHFTTLLIFSIVILFIVIAIFPLIVIGQGQQLPIGPGQQIPAGIGQQKQASEEIENPLKAKDFTQLVNEIAKWIFNIAIAVATVVFLWGGLQFLVSGGNEEKVTEAKKTMLWAAVGLGICLIGAGFTSLIRQLLGA